MNDRARDLAVQKLEALRKSLVIETDPSVRFKIEKDIERMERLAACGSPTEMAGESVGESLAEFRGSVHRYVSWLGQKTWAGCEVLLEVVRDLRNYLGAQTKERPPETQSTTPGGLTTQQRRWIGVSFWATCLFSICISGFVAYLTAAKEVPALSPPPPAASEDNTPPAKQKLSLKLLVPFSFTKEYAKILADKEDVKIKFYSDYPFKKDAEGNLTSDDNVKKKQQFDDLLNKKQVEHWEPSYQLDDVLYGRYVKLITMSKEACTECHNQLSKTLKHWNGKTWTLGEGRGWIEVLVPNASSAGARNGQQEAVAKQRANALADSVIAAGNVYKQQVVDRALEGISEKSWHQIVAKDTIADIWLFTIVDREEENKVISK